MKLGRSIACLAAIALGTVGLTAAVPSTAMALQQSVPAPTPGAMPSAVPSTATPAVDNGTVQTIAQVGNTMIIGGTFTSVAGQSRSRVAAFDRTTGALTSFAPVVNGEVDAVMPGPNANSVYLAGAFTQVGSSAQQFLALVDLTTGAVVTSFKTPAFDYGKVNDIVLSGNRLYAGGYFSKVGGKAHFGLAAFNATTGALDAYVNNQVAGHHNDSGSGAQGYVGPQQLAISPDGRTLVVIGNFKTVDGLPRDQAVMLDLTGGSAVVNPDWKTIRYNPYCFSNAFDSYVRGVAFSPDGSYFVINSTGGGVGGTLCDATARFETSGRGQDIQPTWINESGGDTMWGIGITDTAVFVGGHARWSNNPYGSDYANAGAVPRPGLAAYDPATGRPLKWNPGRNPPGTAVYAILATSTGVYVGSNSDYIGNRQYKRPKIAYFTYAGGAQLASSTTGPVPGTAYLGGSKISGVTNVLYRVNAAGGAVASLDGGPDWSDDSGGDSPYRNSGTNAAGYSTVGSIDATVPTSTPSEIFSSERWSPSDNPAMNWNFPVPAGTPLQVRLYFANRCGCTSGAGQRSFNVDLDGTRVLSSYDIVADVGDNRGTAKSFDITSDGAVNIDFSHVVENPLINGIEIVRTDVTPAPAAADDLSRVAVTPTSTSAATSVSNAGIAWSQVRGAFMVGSNLFYGYSDGTMYRRTFDGSTFGAAEKIDPYHDPAWKDVDNNLGGTFDGASPSLYTQLNSVTGMTFSAGRLYYTLSGDSTLHWRWFSTDSGIMDERVNDVPSSVSFSDANGMYVAGGSLYYVTRSNGNLNKIAFDGTVTGSPTVVGGPATGGGNLANRALFLYSGPIPNQAPTAAFTQSCTNGACTFNGTGSSDPDGSIASYAWNFGDGGTATGATPAHTYAATGTYGVTLTVTDDKGATRSVTNQVSVTVPVVTSKVSYVGTSHSAGGSTKTKTVTVPAGVLPGDTLVLFSTQSNTMPYGNPTGISGLTQVATSTNSTVNSTLFTKAATSGDAGSVITITNAAAGKAVLSLAVYRGVNTAAVTAAALGNAGSTSHVSPTVNLATGSWALTEWTDKSAAVSAWTAPSGVTARDTVVDTGSGRYSFLAADSGGPVSGTYGGLNATTDAASDRGIAWTVGLPTAP